MFQAHLPLAVIGNQCVVVCRTEHLTQTLPPVPGLGRRAARAIKYGPCKPEWRRRGDEAAAMLFRLRQSIPVLTILRGHSVQQVTGPGMPRAVWRKSESIGGQPSPSGGMPPLAVQVELTPKRFDLFQNGASNESVVSYIPSVVPLALIFGRRNVWQFLLFGLAHMIFIINRASRSP